MTSFTPYGTLFGASFFDRGTVFSAGARLLRQSVSSLLTIRN